MATNTNIFTDKETNNWFKACIALNVTKEGLTNFVETEIKHVQNSIGRSCGNCCTQNLVRCPTKGICKKSRNCNYHTQTKQPRQCPVKLCELVAKNVTSLHRYNGPSWFNTKAELWSTDHWQIAKCFFPPDGYINVSSIHDSDFNGVISVLLNCKHFDSCISFTIAPKPPAPECLLTKARQIGRATRHTTNCKVTDAELYDFLQTLDTLLADPKCLAQDPAATAARTKLFNLQKDRLSLTELGELLKEANQTVIKAKETGERFSENAERTLTVGLQTLEAAILAGENRLESKTQDMIVRIQQAANEKEKEDYERAVADLLSRLVEYYRDTVSYVPLSTLNHSLDKHVQDVYVTPKIHRLNIENDGRRTKQEQILTYRDCFYRSDHLSRRTYLQGEPGSGKTSFAAKLVYDWCNVHGPSTESEKEQTTFGDVDILHKFKFLFFISLRDSRNHTYVTHMIKTQLIYKIYAEDEWERAYKLVLKIMKNVMYLVVQDGLDEWPCEHAVPSMDGIPKDHCLVLTTSRPWKLADERIKNSQIDILLEVEGISDPEEFNEKLLRCLLDETKDLEKTVKQFQTFLNGRGLESISSSPMLYTLVLCTYVDHMAESLTGSSMCELYTTMLENLCKKANTQISYFDQYHLSPVKAFACTKYIRPNIDHIDSISKAAFSFLFSNKKESSLVFSDIDLSAHLSETAKQFALESGILSKRKSKRCTDQTLSFVHKTIQEFLAAFHIHRKKDVIEDVLSGYLKRNDNAYSDISQMFIFLCGFNISAANKLSSMMNELDVYREYGHYFQDCIISGYREAVANKNAPIDLLLSHFHFKYYNTEDLIQIWTLNTSRARSLEVYDLSLLNIHVTIRSQDTSSADCHGPGSVSLHARQNPDVANRDDREEIRSSTSCIEFDLSSCHNLERLELSGSDVTVLPNALMGLKKLKHLKLGYCKCETLPLSINNYRTLKSIDICKYDGLDLSLFENLNSIIFGNDVKVLPKPLLIHNKLTDITLHDFDFNDFVYNEDIDTWCLLNGADPVQCADYTPVLPSIQNIELFFGKCSSTWLRSLISTMLTLDHMVECKLLDCYIALDDYEELLISDMSWFEEDEDRDMSWCEEDEDSDISWCEEDEDSDTTDAIITTDLNNTCIFNIVIDSPGLWGTLHDMNVKNLSLRGFLCGLKVHLVSSMSRSLVSLQKLETLTMHLAFHIHLPLPPYLKHLTVLYDTLSPSELRHLVNQLCAFTHSVECKLEFLCGNKIENNTITNIPPEDYITVEQELQTLEHVEVKRFRIYDRTPQTDITSHAAWSVRDRIVDDGDHGDDIGKDELWRSCSSHSDIKTWHSECLNRISLQLQINCEQHN